MREKLHAVIRSFPILTDEEVDDIVDNTRLERFPKGTVLLREGEVAKNCYMVLGGLVREYYIKDGNEHSTAFYTEGQPVTPFTSYTGKTPSKHYLVCAEDCELTVGDQAIEQTMCERIPRLETIIRQEVEKMTARTQDDLADFITSTPEERYLKIMETRPDLLQRVPQHQIASFIGVTPESLSRIRKRLFSEKKA